MDHCNDKVEEKCNHTASTPRSTDYWLRKKHSFNLAKWLWALAHPPLVRSYFSKQFIRTLPCLPRKRHHFRRISTDESRDRENSDSASRFHRAPCSTVSLFPSTAWRELWRLFSLLFISCKARPENFSSSCRLFRDVMLAKTMQNGVQSSRCFLRKRTNRRQGLILLVDEH